MSEGTGDEGSAQHAPIVIRDGRDWGLPGSGVTGGSGTPEDPYIIEGWEIVPFQISQRPRPIDYACRSTGDPIDLVATHVYKQDTAFHGIEIRGVSAHVIIRNNWIHGMDATAAGSPVSLPFVGRPGAYVGSELIDGIFLQNAPNVRIENNLIQDVHDGICATNSPDIEVVGNTIEGVLGDGVRMENTARVQVLDNTIEGGVSDEYQVGLYVAPVTDVRIEGNTISSFSSTGILASALKTDRSEFPVVNNNTVHDIGGTGIYLRYFWRMTIDGNEVHDTGSRSRDRAIYVDDVDGSQITNNHVRDVTGRGLYLASLGGTDVGGNTVERATSHGLFAWYPRELSVHRNALVDNGQSGIHLVRPVLVKVEDNHLSRNGHWGFWSGQSLKDDGGSATIVQHNTVHDNGRGGIGWIHSSDKNRIWWNDVRGNEAPGIYVHSSGYFLNHNNIVDNGETGLLAAAWVDATDNWWGCPGGPDDAACNGIVTNYPQSLTYAPWLTAPVPDAGVRPS